MPRSYGGEALQKVGKGWLLPPTPLDLDGRPFTWRSSQFNISFRFGVEQADKLRACDDLKHSLTNLACSVHTPIPLVSWDHISQPPGFLAKGGGDLVMFKADHEASYKQLPSDPGDQKNAIVALRDPPTQRWHGCVSRTLVFGSVDSVLHYNAQSRILAALTNRCLWIPLVCYFGDFPALVYRCLGKKALEGAPRFLSLLGFQLKPGKSTVGPSLPFLGLLGISPPKENDLCLSISLTPEKRRRWPQRLVNFLKGGKVSRRCMDKLIGKLSSPRHRYSGNSV